MKENLRKIVALNTIANYFSLIIKLITAIFLTRIIFLGLGNTSYGFWALLWSIFGYSLLLDFGFGTSVQKYAAEVSVTRDFTTFNRLLSTVTVSYCIMSVIIAATTVFMINYIDILFKFPPGADISFYKNVMLFFGIGTAITFPTGTFPEILKGLKKIYVINIITIIYMLLNFAGVYALFKYRFGLFELTVFTIFINLLKNLIMWLAVRKYLPEMEINLKLFSKSLLKNVLTFSIFAYLIMFANMIIYKTDQIVLGFMLGLEAVALYQVGSRLSDMMVQFSSQFQANLTPIAAALYKNREFSRLNAILTESNRMIALMATFFFIIMTVLAKQILFVWLKVDDSSVTMIAYVMNVSMYILVLFRSGSSKVLLMAQKHKFLSVIAIIESISNIVLSVIFIKFYGAVGVAIGTLVPNVIFSLFVIFPATCRFTEIPVHYYIRKIYFPVTLISVLPVAVLYYPTVYIPLSQWTVFHLCAVCLASGTVFCISGYFFVLTKENRNRIKELIPFFAARSH